MTKRQSKTRGKELAKTYQDALQTLDPPLKLDKCEVKAFDRVVQSRELDTWTDADLVIACKLARVTVEMDRLWKAYTDRGDGDAFDRYNKLFTPFQRMHNILGMSAGQRAIKSGQRGRDRQQAQAKRKLAAVETLIPRPT